MFWLRTGVLSDKQIKRLLGKKVFIWPFNPANLKGSTYNFTASPIAKSLKTGKLLINDKREIVISPRDTALIETEESIFVEKDICGTYHSKVKLVSKGLSHIGTTLDPLYFGTSLIAVHNHTDEEQTIKVGESFVSLMFHKMSSSTRLLHDNQPFRNDIINLNFNKDDFVNVQEDKIDQILNEIEAWKEKTWRTNQENLIDEVEDFVKKRDAKKKLFYIDWVFLVIMPLLILGIFTYYTYLGKFDEVNMTYVAALTGLIFPAFATIGKILKTYFKGE